MSTPSGTESTRRRARLAVDRWAGRRVLPGPEPAGAVRVTAAGRPLWAQPRAVATPLGVHAEALAAVLARLQGAGLPVIAMTMRSTAARFAVTAADATGVVAALQGLGAGWYVAERWGEDLLRVTPAGRTDAAAWSAVGTVAVLRPVTDPQGLQVLGVDWSVSVEIWRPSASGFRAPGSNRWTPVLPTDVSPTATVEVAGVELPTLPQIAAGHVHDVPFPIDVVYTWVDGSDSRWRARMREHRGLAVESVNERAVADARFRDQDELRYSLRSLQQYAPWVRHIWLVTDQQTPPWLDATSEGITVVDHRSLWADQGALPVFNSHAIESRLHHIEGLAEHYLYLNDDVMLCRRLEPGDFFSPGGVACIEPSNTRVDLGPPTIDDPGAAAAMKNNREMLRPLIEASITQTFRHTPHTQRRSVAYELEEQFAEDYRRVGASRFRSPSDFSPISLQQWYSYRTGRAVRGRLEYAYVDVARTAGLDALATALSRDDLDVICLNQSEDAGAGVDTDRLTALLASTYPFAARFERADGPGPTPP